LNLSAYATPEMIEKLMPFFHKIGDLVNWIVPKIEYAWEQLLVVKHKLDPYHPEELVNVFFGLFLIFFGGLYLTLLATVEAYRMCGWTQTKEYLLDLYEDYKVVRDANAKDNELDENNDGVRDVEQISKKALATRKIKLVLKSCNPQKVTGALSGLNMGFMAVMATLRLQFAQAITLGAVIGDMFQKTADAYLTPLLSRAVPPDYQKWVPIVLRYICRSIGISFAWFLQRIISAFYSALRGGSLFAKGLLTFAGRNGYTAPFNEGSIFFSAIVLGSALPGIYWQISSGFSMPFPINLLMMPFSILEWWLTWMVNSSPEIHNTVAAAA